MVRVWPLTTTSAAGDTGRAAALVAAFAPVAGLVPVAEFVPVAGFDVERLGVGDVGGWVVDCGVAVDDLRVVVGRRLVCAIEADEKSNSSIAARTIVGVVEGFIREVIVC